MAGQQHPFSTGFPGAQQNTMRNQFGGQMVPGLMGAQQGKFQLLKFFENKTSTKGMDISFSQVW